MKKQLSALGLLLVMTAATTALAVGPGKILEFGGGDMGSVIFDGTTHKSAGLTCADCHNPDIFPAIKKGTVKITMEDLYIGKYCGRCHNGKGAFSIKANCDRCHFKAGA